MGDCKWTKYKHLEKAYIMAYKAEESHPTRVCDIDKDNLFPLKH